MEFNFESSLSFQPKCQEQFNSKICLSLSREKKRLKWRSHLVIDSWGVGGGLRGLVLLANFQRTWKDVVTQFILKYIAKMSEQSSKFV